MLKIFSDQPFKSFISGLLDITIIKPIIECGLGYDLITGEDLTSFELTMKSVFVVVDIVTLGSAIVATKGIEIGGTTALKLVGKTVAVTMASDATAYTVGYISNQAGAPLALTMLLSLGSGIVVSKAAGKYIFKNASGKLLGECNVPEENLNLNFGENINNILSKYNISIDEFNDLRLKNVANLTDSEKAMMKSIRESIPMPDSTTEMQKVIPQSDMEKYLDGSYNQVGGYVTRATDVTQLTKYKDLYGSFRLGYPENKYHPVKDDTLGVIVFKTPEAKNFKIPYSKEMGGTTFEKQPLMGNGFTKAKNGQIIPEYKSDEFLKITNGSELYEVSQNGTKKLRAVYNENYGKFIATTN